MFGDPHLVTFDGTRYTFNGKGEYSLVIADAKRLVIQGRTEQLTDQENGKSVVMAYWSFFTLLYPGSLYLKFLIYITPISIVVVYRNVMFIFDQEHWLGPPNCHQLP